MRSAGASYRQIRIEIGCSLRSVQRWMDRYESGQPLSDEPRSGRPTVLTPAVKTSVTRFLKRTPSLRKCEAHLTSCGMTVSRGTIHSYASERLSKVKPRRKAPQLNAQHIEKRLVFATSPSVSPKDSGEKCCMRTSTHSIYIPFLNTRDRKRDTGSRRAKQAKRAKAKATKRSQKTNNLPHAID